MDRFDLERLVDSIQDRLEPMRLGGGYGGPTGNTPTLPMPNLLGGYGGPMGRPMELPPLLDSLRPPPPSGF